MLADPELNAFVHNLTRYQVSSERGTVWYYVAGSPDSVPYGTRLLVLLDGSRLQSVLGERRGGDLLHPGLVTSIVRHGRPGLDVLAVETTFFVEPFANHTQDRRVLKRYTLEDRVLASTLAIDDCASRGDRPGGAFG